MKHTTDLGKDKVPPLVLKLAIPSMIAQFVTVLYSIIDRMFIGNIEEIGDIALAGVGVCGPIVTLLTSFGTFIGLGGSILMAMRMGAGQKREAQSILAHSFAMLVAFSLYALGLIVAIILALLIGKFWKTGKKVPLLIELPDYKVPNPRTIRIYVWEKVKDYLTKAGTTIFVACDLVYSEL
mgnify:CR=1 FL=1